MSADVEKDVHYSFAEFNVNYQPILTRNMNKFSRYKGAKDYRFKSDKLIK